MPPAPGQRCTVCNHPGIVLINNEINQGASDYAIAGQFKLPRNAVQRHRTNKHGGVKEAAATRGSNLSAARQPDPESAPPSDAPDGEGDPRSELEKMIRTLKGQVDADARPEVFRELRLALETLAKMGATQQLVVRVADVEGLRELFREMYLALRPFPEARAALAEVWRRHNALEETDAAAG